MLAGVGALEEDGAVVRPRSIAIFVQRAGTNVILACAHDDIFVAISLEIIRVAEILESTSRCAVDDHTLAAPVGQRGIGGLGLHDASLGVVDGSIQDGGGAIVVVHTATPAAFDVVALARIDGDGLFRPLIEVLAGEVSPVQARHIGAVGILLEEHMIATVGVGHAVGLVGPATTGHAVEQGAPQTLGIALGRIVEVRPWGGSIFFTNHCYLFT